MEKNPIFQKYSLPHLAYTYNALEPSIDARTMEIHYTKHHQTYIDNLNEVLSKHPDLEEMDLKNIMRNILLLPIDDTERVLLQNNGGGHLNHSFFWSIMGPKKEYNEQLIERIQQEFGSLSEFKELFTTTALNCFGSGWTWLVEDGNHQLTIYSTQNQNSPYLNNHEPLIGLDLWEHAYYLQYQNRRAEYIHNWWQVLKLL
ncbi:superoxide dismutase [Candidatus Roizmanbacteria bacterium]|nr:superoxide dismutase [Candidatus Roizmanbacteria bacterium]